MIFKVFKENKIVEYFSYENNISLKFTNCNEDIIENTKILVNNINFNFKNTEETKEDNIYIIKFYIDSNVNLDFIFMKMLKKIF